MCPLRIILIFLSASLAGYFAWKSVKSAEPSPFELPGDEVESEKAAAEDGRSHFCRIISKGFWVTVDMASGRYLWRNLSGGAAAKNK